MPPFCANLTMLYNELDYLGRFAAAAADRFTGIEYLFPCAVARPGTPGGDA
jgi:hydroxypyruvate isomerase